MCRLSKKVEKDRKCREEEGLGCCLKSGKIERWLVKKIHRSIFDHEALVYPWYSLKNFVTNYYLFPFNHSLIFTNTPYRSYLYNYRFIFFDALSFFFPLNFSSSDVCHIFKKKTARIEGRTKRETPIETTIVPAVIVGKFLERNVRILEYIIIIVSCSMDWTVFLSQAKKKEMGEAFRQNG